MFITAKDWTQQKYLLVHKWSIRHAPTFPSVKTHPSFGLFLSHIPCPSTSTKTNQLFKMLKHLHRAFYVPGSILNTLCTVILQFCEAGAIHIPTLQMEKKNQSTENLCHPL